MIQVMIQKCWSMVTRARSFYILVHSGPCQIHYQWENIKSITRHCGALFPYLPPTQTFRIMKDND